MYNLTQPTSKRCQLYTLQEKFYKIPNFTIIFQGSFKKSSDLTEIIKKLNKPIQLK